MENNKKTDCPNCGAKDQIGKFCSECGFSFEGLDSNVLNKTFNNTQFANLSISEAPLPQTLNDNQIDPLDNKDMILVADYIRKTIATAVGDSYKEVCIWKLNDGSYRLDTYSKDFGSHNELHKAYLIDESFVMKVLKRAKEEHLEKWGQYPSNGMCGGIEVFKYIEDGVVFRVTSDQLAPGVSNFFGEIRRLMYDGLCEDREVFEN